MLKRSAFLVVPLLSGVVAAQEGTTESNKEQSTSQRVATLPTVFVTATKTEESPLELPYSVDSIDADAAREIKSARSAADALKEIPGVMIQQTAGQQQSPFIRGFTGYRTLFMVDGVRLNNSVFRDGPIQYFSTIDPYSIQSYEVVKGPASTLWGSDAIGGAINALTKRRSDYSKPGLNWDGRAIYRYSTAENSNIGRIEASANQDDKWGLFAGGSLKNFGNVEGGKETGEQNHTGYDEHDFDLRFDYTLSPSTNLTLVHQQYMSLDAPRVHRTIFAIPFPGTTPGKLYSRDLDQNRALTYAKIESENVSPLVDNLSATLSYQKQGEYQHVVKALHQAGGYGPGGEYSAIPDSREEFGWDVATLGLNVNARSTSAIGTLTYGFDWYRDSVDSYQRLYDKDGVLDVVSLQGPVADNSDYTTTGLFIQDQFFIVPERLEATLGARYTHAKVHAGKVGDPLNDLASPNPISGLTFDENWSATAGTARVTYHVDQQWRMFGGASQGFRAPSLFDLTGDEQARTNEAQIGNTDLSPEKFTSYEIGVKSEQQNLTLQAAYFYTDIKDMIIRVPTGTYVNNDPTEDAIIKAENGGHGFIRGIELEGSYRFERNWLGYGNFTWMDGELAPQYSQADPNTPEKAPTSRLMPTQLILGARWTAADRRMWLDASGMFVQKQDKLSMGDRADTSRIPVGGTPGYNLYGIRAGYKVSQNFTAGAGLENITDKDYRVHGSGLQGPGRNLVLNLDYKF